MKNNFLQQKGFTVLELLVVLFIMTLLLSIVLVSFTRGNKNTQNKVSVSEFRLVQVALEEYRAQCRVYPLTLETDTNNAFPNTSDCILKFGQLIPPDINLEDFEYTPLRGAFSESGVCSAYHLARELYPPSRYLQEDNDWNGDTDWPACTFTGSNALEYLDPIYDFVYGLPN